MVDDLLVIEDGNRSADVEDLSAVHVKSQKVSLYCSQALFDSQLISV